MNIKTMNKENDNKRSLRAKLNIIVSLLKQIVTVICGIIVPRLLIATYGSETYGATTSITQFLAYITLLEGGIGGVARAALYKPLAENDIPTVSTIVYEIKRFFRVIGYIFAAYVIILACSFKRISHIEVLDWWSTFLLVLVISISTFAQYFIGISNSVLLQAAQQTYISYYFDMLGTILNTVLIIILVHIGSDIIVVKFASSCVFVLRPILLWLFVRRNFRLENVKKSDVVYLKQKWDGLAQHIAFFLNSNTDVAVLTVFSSLTSVAVYSVYSMIVTHIKSFATSFSTGMEALFGDMLAKKEIEELNRTFDYYDMMISYMSTVLFSVTIVMIIPFVRIYTRGVSDANYIDPLFALLLSLAYAVTCLLTPYHEMTIAAGYFRQTKLGAYGEAIINLGLSIILVVKFGLVGVAIGTLVAALFRFTYYAIYLRTHIFNRPIRKWIKREVINVFSLVSVYGIGELIKLRWEFSGYVSWAICALIVTICAGFIITVINAIFYPQLIKKVLNRLKLKKLRVW